MLAGGNVNLPLSQFIGAAVALGAIYGFFMGWFAVLNRTPVQYVQLLAAMVKLPLLFLLTLLVSFPSLYVFNALVGCRLGFVATLKLLIGAIVVNLAVAASFGTILGFFTLSTTSYEFMVLLNVALLGLAGFVGLGFLLRVLRRVALWQAVRLTNPQGFADVDKGGPTPAGQPAESPDSLLGPANAVFRVWVVIFGLVGAQMAWLLRPFIGSPALPFEWFRPRSGNFFLSVLGAIQKLADLRH